MAGNKGAENLKPCRDTETAKARGKQGGIASGKAKRKKKLLSEIYGEVIADLYGVDAKKGASAQSIIKDIIRRRDAASVSMLKEVREATEGSKQQIELTANINPDDENVKAILEKHGIKNSKD